MNYLSVVPGKFHCNLYQLLSHLIPFHSNNSIKTKVYPSHQHVLGYSTRSLFNLIINKLIKRKFKSILVTPWLHSSFYHILKDSGLKIEVIDYDENFNLIFPDNIKSKCILISHNFGSDKFLWEKLEPLINEKNLYVIEDRVQGGFYSRPLYNENTEIVLFSGGQDKIPVSFGGGIALVKNLEDSIILENEINNLSEGETFFARWIHIFKKIGLYLLYNVRWILKIVILLFKLLGNNPETASIKVRKSYPGFVHHGYMKKPTNYQIGSINYSLNNLPLKEMLEIEMKRKFFYKRNKQPWFHHDTLLNNNGNFYYHFYCRDKNFISKMSQLGYICMPQQTWKTFGNEKLLDNIYLIPNLSNMSWNEIKLISDVLKKTF